MAISYEFNGTNKTISVIALDTDYINNVLTISAKDVYSAWKQWCKNDVGLQYLQAFDTLGGDPIDNYTSVGDYYFLRTDNGWSIVPPNKDNTVLVVQGNLYPRIPGDHILTPIPNITTTFILQTSSLTQTITTGSGVVDANIIAVNSSPVSNIDEFKSDTTGLATKQDVFNASQI